MDTPPKYSSNFHLRLHPYFPLGLNMELHVNISKTNLKYVPWNLKIYCLQNLDQEHPDGLLPRHLKNRQ